MPPALVTVTEPLVDRALLVPIANVALLMRVPPVKLLALDRVSVPPPCRARPPPP